MEIDYRGANCVVIKSKSGIIVTDPTGDIKANEVSKENAVTLLTNDAFYPKDASFVIDMPGEYEHNNISIKGIPLQSAVDEDDKKSTTAYSILIDGIRIVVTGHIKAPIGSDDDDTVEELGIVDVVIIPVVGGGTLDAHDSATVVRQLSPKIVIPTHYADKNIKYEVPQEELDLFLKEIGASQEKISNLKIKSGSLPETLTIYEIARN